VTEIESIVEPDCVTDDVWWKSVSFICIHPLILSNWVFNLAVPQRDMRFLAYYQKPLYKPPCLVYRLLAQGQQASSCVFGMAVGFKPSNNSTRKELSNGDSALTHYNIRSRFSSS
jgi:hypothetical protein